LVRLANGSFSQEGRIEICYSGLWASACSNGWGKADALVVCRQLGFSNSEPNVSTNAEYGSGNGPMFYSRFNCQGWESTLSACSTSYTYSHGCNSNTIAGVICTDGCIDGKLRLVGGTNEQEGTIEICHNNLWGLIADASWDDDDAEVVCRQLKLPSKGALAVKGSFYGKPDRAIHYSYVLCHGNESLITKCEKLTHTLHDGRVIYDDAQVAGVKCLPAPLNSDTTCSNNAPTITVGSDCIDGNVTLTEKGILHYCYNGHWSILCSLSHKEAIVACRQLGYTQYTCMLLHVLRYNYTFFIIMFHLRGSYY
jgi:deleted-in-malignant-brain-tumors protein 1